MYYDSIEEAIKAAPDCTHVLTTGSKWDGWPGQEGKFIVAYQFGEGNYHRANSPQSETWDVAGGKWAVFWVNDTSRTVEQRLAAARFDQAATERQVGGDHYKSLKIQPIEYIDANNLPYLEGNVIKYVTRHASKNGVQDIDKAIHYLELIKQMRYSDEGVMSAAEAVNAYAKALRGESENQQP